MFCLYFTYICPGAESNGYLHGTHSIDSDEVAQVSQDTRYKIQETLFKVGIQF